MLPDPQTGEPLIAWCLDLVNARNWSPLVVLRKEKIALRAYLRERQVPMLEVAETREWPESILKSEELWGETNLMILPDTRFSKISVLDDMAKALETSALAFATFQPNDFSTWGVVRSGENGLHGCEKPLSLPGGQSAWGVIGFQRQIGLRLFTHLLQSTLTHEWYQMPETAAVFSLDFFKDLTRG